MISDAYHRLFYDVSYIPAVKVRILKGLFHQTVICLVIIVLVIVLWYNLILVNDLFIHLLIGYLILKKTRGI